MKTNNNLCCIFNVAPHYNGPLYLLMDRNMGCDFYIGDKVELPIHLMDYHALKGFRKQLKNIFLLGHFYWQLGALHTLSKSYRNYLMTAEVYNLSTWILLIFLRITRKNSYLWTHGWYGNEGRLKSLIKKMFFHLANGIFLYGEHAKKLMIQEGFDENKLHVIYNSMDYDTQLQIRNQLSETDIYKNKFKNNDPVLIYVGRIQKMKKLDMLIHAVNDLYNKNIKCNLVIVGKMVEDTGLQQLTNELHLEERVWFYGPCFDENILGELFFNASLCVTPGNIGLTAIHSMMYGTPVVTHDDFSEQGPEFEAIIPGLTGGFFPVDNQEKLNEIIAHYIGSENDRSFERRKSFEVVDQKYNPHKQIELLKNVIYSMK